jgi:2-succinyl-5-enolpyruvyl-6-hydroxy-3-cyclohexene-1-carboxylate synthase
MLLEQGIMPNRNSVWSQVLVDELVRSGLEAVCIAPGSRSTPLTLAFAQHPHVKIYTHLDERSAGFFALGMAIASDKPIALVCTSGSATVNFFPAIVEAHESRVPLIVLTTDRPHELRHSGANQTIDQVKIFGGFALWAVDCALPEAKPSSLAIRNLRTTANRAYAIANGQRKGGAFEPPFPQTLRTHPCC